MSESVVTGLEETWKGITRLLADVEDDDWRRPTPCAEWDVHDLAAHLGAVEGFFQGLPQPAEPPSPTEGIDAWTAAGVDARRSWAAEDVLREVEEVATIQLERLRSLDDEGWQRETIGPVGRMTERGRAEMRLMDLYVHLLDLRSALDRPLDLDAEPTALEQCVERAFAVTGWGAVKRARLGDGARIRLELSGRGGRVVDLVVEDGRGHLRDPESDTRDRVEGTAPAYLLTAAGRPEMVDAAGVVTASADDASALLDRFRIFG